MRTITINTTPNIQYGNSTKVDYANITIDNFGVNITLTETYFDNVTFNLYNSSGSNINSDTYSDGTRCWEKYNDLLQRWESNCPR